MHVSCTARPTLWRVLVHAGLVSESVTTDWFASASYVDVYVPNIVAHHVAHTGANARQLAQGYAAAIGPTDQQHLVMSIYMFSLPIFHRRWTAATGQSLKQPRQPQAPRPASIKTRKLNLVAGSSPRGAQLQPEPEIDVLHFARAVRESGT